MRLLYVIDSLSPGGAERSLAAMAPHWVRSGLHLDVAYLHERPGVQEDLQRAGAELLSLGTRGDRRASIRRVRAAIAERRPDLVHTTLFEADVAGRIAARLARVPVVSSLVNLEYGPDQLSDPRLKAWKIRGAQAADAMTGMLARRFHAISRTVADVMAGRLLIPGRKIEVIPRGRDPAALGARTAERRASARASIGVGPEDLLILGAARQEHQKGLDLLIEALPAVLARVPAARLVLAGREGHHTPTLQAAVARLDLDDRVAFLGARSDVPDLLAAADVFAFPSRWEGLGSVLIEAMALEAPIVASDLDVVREFLEEGVTARLTPVGDPGALADAISDVLVDPAPAEDRAAAARAVFLERFTVDRVAERMLDFYERALSRSGRL